MIIYEHPDVSKPIKQGDIFHPLPKISLDLTKLTLVESGALKRYDWNEVKDKERSVINTAIEPVWAIVATQDCDAIRSPVISLFEINLFKTVSSFTLPTTPKKWVSVITQKSRLNARWFYLPCDSKMGFPDRMAINFHTVIQVPRKNLEELKELRKGRLNKIAYQHYRESIARYFRRYPYDEWYPLNKEEFAEYNKESGPVEPFEGQADE